MRLGTGDGSFQNPVDYLTGGPATTMETEDINQDGNLDFVAATSSEVFTVFLGDGLGSFQNGVNYPAGVNPAAIAIRDFTGDGIPDIGVANHAIFFCCPQGTVTGTVTLQVGLGGGAFTEFPTEQPVVPNLKGILGADFNSDGDSDFAVARNSPETYGIGEVHILLGSVGAGFQLVGPYGVTGHPTDLATGDFNGDTSTDLVVSAFTNQAKFSYGLGTGNGEFGAFIGSPNNGSGQAVTSGDFNHDGIDDIAVTSDKQIDVLLANGDGTFMPPTSYTAGDTVGMYGIVAVDLNGDGNLDFAVSNSKSGTVSVLLGNPDGTFGPKVALSAGSSPFDLVAADFNSDGNIDLVVTNQEFVGLATLVRGNGDGTFMPPESFAVGAQPTTATVGDVNGDGHIDLVVNSVNGGIISILFGGSPGTFQTALHYTLGGIVAGVALADVDQNGTLDIAVTKSLGNGVTVLLNDGAWPAPLPIGDGPGFEMGIRGTPSVPMGRSSETPAVNANPRTGRTPAIDGTSNSRNYIRPAMRYETVTQPDGFAEELFSTNFTYFPLEELSNVSTSFSPGR